MPAWIDVEAAIAGGRAVSAAVVLTHTQPEQTSAALRERRGIAERAGWSLVAAQEELDKHGDAAAGIGRHRLRARRSTSALVLGGDGTILKGLREYGANGVPVFGVNYGTVGFLAAVEPDELAEASSAPSPATSR